MSNQSTKISILLPTRGRTDALDRSIMSLINLASDPKNLQFVLAFDNDDTASSAYFVKTIAPNITNAGALYTCLEFSPLGYTRLNEYVNKCADVASGDWLMFWNDDAFMESANWDQEIIKHTGEFCCLRMPTHNEHPYAIFPIIPKKWHELFGYLSAHQISDAWISQISYMLDIVKNINVKVIHDRHDLTGNNNDETFKNRVMFEGRPEDPRDFNHLSWRKCRLNDAIKISQYLDSVGQDTTWFRNVLALTQDPWETMTSPEFDPNKQLKKFKVPNVSRN